MEGIGGERLYLQRDQGHKLLVEEDFVCLSDWISEGGTVAAAEGDLDIIAPDGCTVWLRRKLEIRAVHNGGAYDQVSDVNCFWMAAGASPDRELLLGNRSGLFREYDELCLYYAGLGVDRNTASRFRKYPRQGKPLHEFNDHAHLLTANRWMHIEIIVDGHFTSLSVDHEIYFELDDPNAYQTGFFGFRTFRSHIQARNFKVYSLNNALEGQSGCE
jgi:hypothetical protein